LDIGKIRAGKRVSVPREKVNQPRPWEEPYGTVVGTISNEGVSVRLDGECATVIRVRPEDLDEE
jgi:hypothetical protein